MKIFKSLFASEERIYTFIEFPIKNLYLNKYSKDTSFTPIYNLYAVTNHYGSIGFGHYTAFAWNRMRHGWYCFNDNDVSRMKEEDVCTNSAYVLFYARKDIVETIDQNNIKQVIPKDNKIPITNDESDIYDIEVEEERKPYQINQTNFTRRNNFIVPK